MARLYVDENLGGDFILQLRALGHDVVSASEVGAGKTDAWHFRSALEDDRILVTLDRRDFAYVHRLWTTLHQFGVVTAVHPGILVAIQSASFTMEGWTQAVHERLAIADDLSGHMYRWHSSKEEWLEHAWRPEN